MVKKKESAGDAVSATSTFANTVPAPEFAPCARRIGCATEMAAGISSLAEALVERVPASHEETVVCEMAGRIAQLAGFITMLLGDEIETIESLSRTRRDLYPGYRGAL